MADVTWLTTSQAAARIQRDPSRVRRAAEEQELHGHQRLRNGRPVPGSRWTFADTAVDAWVRGGDLHTQRHACGCASLRAVQKTA